MLYSMAGDSPAEASAIPWARRLFDAVPWSPVWVALAVGLALFAATQAVDAWVLGFDAWFWGAAEDEPLWQDEGTRALGLLSLLLGAVLD